MFCTACGSRNGVDSKFCAQCGHKLSPLPSGRVTVSDFEKSLPPDEQVQALLERAYQMRREGDIAAAIDYCTEALSVRPESTATHALLAQLYEANGDRARAVAQYERILELNPGSIADRVKLDEMRRGSPARQTTPLEPPQRTIIVERPNPWNVAGSALGLLAICGFAIVYLRPSTASERPDNSSSRSSQRTQQQQIASADTNNAGSSYNNRAPQQAPQQPPIIYIDPSKIPGYYGSPPPQNYPGRGVSRLSGLATIPAPGYRPTQPKANKAASDDEGSSGKRIHMDEDDSTNNQITIHVEKSTAPEGQGRVSVTPPGSPAPSRQGADPSSQSLIAMAHDAAAREDYDRAIGFLRQALPTSGDSTAYVNQSIATYYERLNDKKPSPSYQQSAARYYGDAIQEFNRLSSNGKLSDSDRAALRACEIGKKKCGG